MAGANTGQSYPGLGWLPSSIHFHHQRGWVGAMLYILGKETPEYKIQCVALSLLEHMERGARKGLGSRIWVLGSSKLKQELILASIHLPLLARQVPVGGQQAGLEWNNIHLPFVSCTSYPEVYCTRTQRLHFSHHRD